jgi:hypothetical protein
MSRLIIVAAAITFACSAAAWGQTKQQCTELSNTVPKMVKMVAVMSAPDQLIAGLQWSKYASQMSGQMRAAAQEAERAQENLIAALKRYRVALEDVTHQAQLCAR